MNNFNHNRIVRDLTNIAHQNTSRVIRNSNDENWGLSLKETLLTIIITVLVLLGLIFLVYKIEIPGSEEKYEEVKVSVETDSSSSIAISEDVDYIIKMSLYQKDGLVLSKEREIDSSKIKDSGVSDTVIYNNLRPGTKYEMKSSLYDSQGNLIKSFYSISFTPKKEDVVVTVEY